ncbi:MULTISPECIES: hypothetical protein [unclassified Cryobacterium]|nr:MULTISPECIES: hypothetical protein [unclassified Cryobacterium]MDY7541167.1 hypothetical protein [Cryobacterium sp. 5B3]MEA9998917.1 hypothetical protein [Cryobacterium sp. RTS3]MEB0267086.1 hypothetical protein [Cryobacterium sp. 10I5]MEB0274262.1 hypothetical protein [Cryobacterium sp. 5B3]
METASARVRGPVAAEVGVPAGARINTAISTRISAAAGAPTYA